jgi:hypothetical protein
MQWLIQEFVMRRPIFSQLQTNDVFSHHYKCPHTFNLKHPVKSSLRDQWSVCNKITWKFFVLLSVGGAITPTTTPLDPLLS